MRTLLQKSVKKAERRVETELRAKSLYRQFGTYNKGELQIIPCLKGARGVADINERIQQALMATCLEDVVISEKSDRSYGSDVSQDLASASEESEETKVPIGGAGTRKSPAPRHERPRKPKKKGKGSRQRSSTSPVKDLYSIDLEVKRPEVQSDSPSPSSSNFTNYGM
jgi:hypothetical protein